MYYIPGVILRRFVVLSIAIISSVMQGQTAITIKNKMTDKAVSYANVWKDHKIYVSSDSLGLFYVPETDLQATFKISALGYKTKDSVALKSPYVLYLDEDLIALKEVVVTQPKFAKKSKLGSLKNGDVGVVSEKDKEVAQFGKYFPNNSTELLFLDTFKFKALCSTKSRVVTIVVYSVGDDGGPKEVLTTDPIVCKLKKGHNVATVDLRPYKIAFPSEGLFVMVNYLFLEENRQYGTYNKNWFFYEPSLDAVLVDEYLDSWYIEGFEWKKNTHCSASFQLTVSD